jgi:F-type H+-transporting ATPase subunit b
MKHLRRPRLMAAAAGLLVAFVPLVASAAEGESSGGIAALGVNLPGLLAQFVNFLILLVILRLFLYGPLVRMLDQRKARIEEGLRRSEEAATQAASSESEARAAMEKARAEAREVMQRAQDTATRLRGELEQQARADAERIVQQARADIDLERQQAIQQLRAEFASLTMTAAERVIGQSLARQAHPRLIDEVLVSSDFGRDGQN